VGSFSTLLDIQHALFVVVMDVVFTIEYAQLKGFKRLWLECDSLLSQAFGLTQIIHWILKGR